MKNMKRFLFGLSLSVFSMLSAQDFDCEKVEDECPESVCEEAACCCPSLDGMWEFEVRVAYVYPTTSLVRNIFDGTRIDGELEATRYFWGNLGVWANATFLYLDGHSIGLGNSTSVEAVPLSLGIKYAFLPFFCVSPYLGVGANYTWMHLVDHSVPWNSPSNRFRFGATGKSGFYVNFTERFFMDVYADYLFLPMDYANAFNVGGFRFGAGFGGRW
jgi:outer membrane protein W